MVFRIIYKTILEPHIETMEGYVVAETEELAELEAVRLGWITHKENSRSEDRRVGKECRL